MRQWEAGLRDAPSRPQVSSQAIAARTARCIVELRRRFLTQARIGRSLGVSESTVSRAEACRAVAVVGSDAQLRGFSEVSILRLECWRSRGVCACSVREPLIPNDAGKSL